ncbi:thiamine diphosphokinase [Paracoccus jiaweipingae]|uniref:thiamine diphosphokinase n=1 Tax=unclassified Paracoccus (in: a-proteobacteria) TaxID=2688777 RepID=UPI0037A56E10
MTPLIRSRQGVTLLGGAPVAADDLTLALDHAPVLVAADGGADRALELGHMPRAVIGDLDSLSERGRSQVAAIHHIPEQDSTDFEKALSRIQAPFVMAAGFADGRMDHMLAALSVMARRIGPPCVMLMPQEICFLAPARLELPLAPGTRVSLFPMGPVRGTSRGLRWPIDKIEFSPAGRVGTSNQATGGVELALDGPMLVMLPRDCLSLTLAAIRS